MHCLKTIKFNPELHYASALLQLAALFHDLGKASRAFQSKLNRGEGYEALRHDILSFLIVSDGLSEYTRDTQWLEHLVKDPACVAQHVSATRLVRESHPGLLRASICLEKGCLNPDAPLEGVLLDLNDQRAELDDCPGRLTVLWLVLTHHRLPTGEGAGEIIGLGQHLNREIPEIKTKPASLQDCLTPAKGKLPWQDSGWQESVRSAARAALTAHAELIGKEAVENASTSQDTILTAAHLLRPLLILADHLGSLQAERGEPKKLAFSSGEVFANTIGKNHAGDPLAVHLRKVKRLSRKLLLRTLTARRFPSLALPLTLFSEPKEVPDAYRWQGRLAKACAEARKQGPAFVAVLAGTGTGKTRGGLRAMQALRPEGVRFTAPLGLRSLTWQSGRAYLEEMNLPKTDVVVAVGEPQTLGLDDLAEQLQRARKIETEGAVAGASSEPTPSAVKREFNDTEASGYFGSESAEGEVCADLDPGLGANAEHNLEWLEGLMSVEDARKLWTPKALAMISSPVLVCTTDHLVSAITLRRGGDAKLFPRLMTSDLLLDEIDGYEPTALQSLGKLVFIAGLAGRHVVAMSATLAPAVFEGLYREWQRGLQLRSRLIEAPAEPLSKALDNPNLNAIKPQAPGTLICVSDLLEPQTLPGLDSIEANAAWARFVDWHCTCLKDPSKVCTKKRPKISRLEFKATTPGGKGRAPRTLDEAFELITEEAHTLHNDNFVVDPKSGKRVSVGCVRLNRARMAWDYAAYLARRPSADSTQVLFVSYHSKYQRAQLGVLDYELRRLTTRKTPHQHFEASTPLREALDAANDITDVIIIVSSTSLIETGRDFDFDWGIIEPSGPRSAQQFNGRIRRHRSECWEAVNVAFLDRPLEALESAWRDEAKAQGPQRTSKAQANPKRVWARPGIEDALEGLRVTREVPPILAQTVAVSSVAAPPVRGPARSSTSLGYVDRTEDALPFQQWLKRFDVEVCIRDQLPYAENRIGKLEHFIQFQHLNGNDPVGPTVSLKAYATGLYPLNERHAKLTPFRSAQRPSALFFPTSSGVIEFQDLPGSGVKPVRYRVDRDCVEISAVPANNALLPHSFAQAEELVKERANDVFVAGCVLPLNASGAPSRTKLSFDPLLGFREGISSS
jgi:CRISPR-associated endonuclease/helicase Cas3